MRKEEIGNNGMRIKLDSWNIRIKDMGISFFFFQTDFHQGSTAITENVII